MPMSRCCRLLTAAGSALVAVAVVSGCSARFGQELRVTGFQPQEAATDRITYRAGALTHVVVAGVSVSSDGTGVEAPTAVDAAQLRAAHEAGLPAELLVSNYDTASQAFSPTTASALLGDAGNRTRVVEQVVAHVEDGGWDGVNVDLEALEESDPADFTAFLAEMREELPRDASLSVDVSARTSEPAYEEAGYDLEAIGEIVDQFILMAYDQHGPWSGRGPVGGLEWQRRALAVVQEHVPDERIDLGTAGYGYVWGPGGDRSVSVQEARDIVGDAGVEASWDAEVGEWTADLPDGSTLWWADARSYAERVALARDAGVGGIAVWSLSGIEELPDLAGV